MKNSKLIIGISTFVLLAACIAVSLYFRVALPFDKIFTHDWIKFSGTDSYLFMRIADNIIHNYPKVINFDPYSLYPGGFPLLSPPFFPFLIATTALAVTFGSASQTMIDTVGVYIPAIMGALTIIPVFFIGKYVFNRWVGIIAAALVAILPGEFLGRSILGFTDQHVAETLISTTAVLFFILAIRSANEYPDVLSAWRSNRGKFYRLLAFGVLSGLFLGLYLITWYGALLFVMIIFIFVLVMQIIRHFSNQPMGSLTFVSCLSFVVSLIVYLFTAQGLLVIMPLLIALLVPVILNFFSIFLHRRNLQPLVYPVSIAVIGALAVLCLYLFSPTILQQMWDSFKIVFFWHINSTILEQQPIFFPGNQFNMAAVWGNFTSSIFLVLPSLGFLIYMAIKDKRQDLIFLIIWSIIIFLATLSQRRFAYYFVVNDAILTGYICWLVFDKLTFKNNRALIAAIWSLFSLIVAIAGFAGGYLALYPDFLFSLLIALIIGICIFLFSRKPEQVDSKGIVKTKKQLKKGTGKRERQILLRRVNPVISISVIFSICLVVLFPNRVIGESTAGSVLFAPSDAWCESLTWLKSNTPEPFENSDYYYNYYQYPTQAKPFTYPQSAYSIASWWDYGYWITRIGHRIPVSNPGTNHNGEAYYFMANSEEAANEIMNKWNAKYVILNVDMSGVRLKFYAISTLSGNDVYKYVDAFYTENNGQLQPQVLYYPAYFQTMVVRLYNFGGAAFVPTKSIVTTYQQKKTQDGIPYKLVTSSKTFNTFEAAQSYLSGLKTSDQAGIFSDNPFSSPIPLEQLNHYKLVHDSVNKVTAEQGVTGPEVRIFEYTK